MNQIKISPSILSCDFSEIGKEIEKLNHSGADLIHVDVMDGHFVPNLTFGPPVIKKIRKCSDLPFDVHLMISPVEKYIKDYAEAGADIITFHPEATEDIGKTIEVIRSYKKKVGISLNPETPSSVIENYLKEIDLILIMSVNPGFAGQKFMPEVLEKVKFFRSKIDNEKLNVDIEIDGGIDFETAPLAIRAGANILVSGTTIFKGGNNISENIKNLRKQ
jgi:ribulose-phosphate 3-epimerase